MKNYLLNTAFTIQVMGMLEAHSASYACKKVALVPPKYTKINRKKVVGHREKIMKEQIKFVKKYRKFICLSTISFCKTN